jgi:hypothetical protein
MIDGTFDSAFFITISTMGFAFLGVVVRYLLKSKCKDVKCCWGMFECERAVELEEEIEKLELANNRGSNRSNSELTL